MHLENKFDILICRDNWKCNSHFFWRIALSVVFAY